MSDLVSPSGGEELLRLADACEKAVGASRELDAEIALMIGWRRADVSDQALYFDWIEPDGCGCTEHDLPRWSASLDAALSLVPEGWRWHRLYPTQDRRFGVEVLRLVGPMLNSPGLWFGYSNHIALALCAASLRARASLLTGPTDT